MVLRVVPEELARVVSLADECSAAVGSVSVEPGSGGDLGSGVLVAAAAAYAAAHSAGARDGAAGADQIAGGVKYAMSALAEADESSASGARGCGCGGSRRSGPWRPGGGPMSAVPVGLSGLAAVVGARVPGSPGGVRSLAASWRRSG